MDEHGIARLFSQTNFGDFPRDRIKPSLIAATRQLLSDQALVVFGPIIRGRKLTEVRHNGAHAYWLVRYDEGENQSHDSKRIAADTMLEDLADHVSFEFADLGGNNGSCTPYETPHGIEAVITLDTALIPPPDTEGSVVNRFPHFFLSMTILHELAHAARFVYRRDDFPSPGHVEADYIFGGCESSEEGFEMETALIGGRLHHSHHQIDGNWVVVVPTLLQWPDPHTVEEYDNPDCNPIRTRAKLDGCHSRYSCLSPDYINSIFDDPPGTPLRRPDPPRWKSAADYRAFLNTFVSRISHGDDRMEAPKRPKLTRADSAIAVDIGSQTDLQSTQKLATNETSSPT